MVVSLPFPSVELAHRRCRRQVPLQALLQVVRVETYPCCFALSVLLAAVAVPVARIVAVFLLLLRRVVARRLSRWPVFALHPGSVALLAQSGMKVLQLGLSLFSLRPMESVSLAAP